MKFNEIISIKFLIIFSISAIIQIIIWYSLAFNKDHSRHFIKMDIEKNDNYLRELNFNSKVYEELHNLFFKKLDVFLFNFENEKYNSPLSNLQTLGTFYDLAIEENFKKTFTSTYLLSHIDEYMDSYFKSNGIEIRELSLEEIFDLFQDEYQLDQRIIEINIGKNLNKKIFNPTDVLSIANEFNALNSDDKIEELKKRITFTMSTYNTMIKRFHDITLESQPDNKYNFDKNMNTYLSILSDQAMILKDLVSKFADNYKHKFTHHQLEVKKIDIKYLYILIIINVFVLSFYFFVRLIILKKLFKNN